MRKAKKSVSKPGKGEEEAVTFLATLAARIAPPLSSEPSERLKPQPR
jgi:hypothetical protein